MVKNRSNAKRSFLRVKDAAGRTKEVPVTRVKKKYITPVLLEQVRTETPVAEVSVEQEPSTVAVIEKPLVQENVVVADKENTTNQEADSNQSGDKKHVEFDKAKKRKKSTHEEKEKHRRREVLKESFIDPNSEAARYRKKHKHKKNHTAILPEKTTIETGREISIPEVITVSDLAQKMSVKAAEVIHALMKLGTLATINQSLDQETAEIVVETMGHKPKRINANELEENLVLAREQQMGEPVTRPPVVTIMGHVDHGKTSLLDYIRSAKVSLKEAGGITQHIGAYHVEVPKGMITFLDTPGHSAFTAMRARGTKVTDIVVLVVAADDGVKPQTIEAIQHAKAANVPIVVAINKIDRAGADLERIKTDLANQDLIPEKWGGHTMFVSVSAKTGEGVDDLLDSILAQAEVLELKAPVVGPAQGVVIESRLDKGRGSISTILVQRGVLHKGDILLAGSTYGRVLSLSNEVGQQVIEAGPSMPVEVMGLSGLPNVGDEAVVLSDERKAREISLFRAGKIRAAKLAQRIPTHTENIFEALGEQQAKILNLVVKADVQGSAEVLQHALTQLSTDEVKVKVIGLGIGAINESDVNLALTTKALILGFNVRADNTAKRMIEQGELSLSYHSVIYDLLDRVKQTMAGLLAPQVRESIIGLAQVRAVFRSGKLGTVAGCMVIEGVVKRNNPIRILRNNVVVHEGELNSLRRFKEDVAEVRQGLECGIGIKNYSDVRQGDQIEIYERTTVARDLA